MTCKDIQIFVCNGEFAKSNKDSVSKMYSAKKIESNGWTCNIFPDCIRCLCTRKNQGRVFQFRFRFELGGHLTFKVKVDDNNWKTLEDTYYPAEPNSFPDMFLCLTCHEIPKVSIRSLEEQHMFDKYHFKKFISKNPNGNYEFEDYETKFGKSSKTFKTDGEVTKTFTSNLNCKDGNGINKNIAGNAEISGASYVIYRVSRHMREEQIEESTLFSNLTLLEVFKILEKKKRKKI